MSTRSRFSFTKGVHGKWYSSVDKESRQWRTEEDAALQSDKVRRQQDGALECTMNFTWDSEARKWVENPNRRGSTITEQLRLDVLRGVVSAKPDCCENKDCPDLLTSAFSQLERGKDDGWLCRRWCAHSSWSLTPGPLPAYLTGTLTRAPQ